MYTSHYRFPRWFDPQAMLIRFTQWYCSVRADGLEHLPPTGAFILASNHSSHADTAVIFVALPPNRRRTVVVAAARDYFFTSRGRQFASRSLFNAVPLDREASLHAGPLRHASRALREGYGLLIYPEGTRGMTGAVGKFRGGLGLLMARHPGVPVVPVAVDGTDTVMPKKSLFPRRHPVRVRFGAPLHDLGALEHDVASMRRAVEEVRGAVVGLKHALEEERASAQAPRRSHGTLL
ncbi:MAG: hypothetical protein RLZZ387_4025 [Chloroflexota bacterium]|jgi:1-acyl-sn-glycerol-3-phosphate acyltransferase